MTFNKLKDEKGVSILLLALSFVILLGFGALAIDIAHLYHVKNELQVAADAAALAGAGEIFYNSATNTMDASKAVDAACRIAACNVADVAYKTGLQPESPGEAIRVRLDPTTTGPNADVQVGYWDTAKYTFTPNGTPTNAVKVIAKRMGAQDQPSAQNWFAKVFALLGSNFDVTNISATAIAAKPPLRLAAIAVNEYWRADYIRQHPGGGPYADNVHEYPSSFVRQIEVAPTGVAQTVTSPAFGYTFAILGGDANSNQGSADPNGYIEMDYRSDYYFGGPISIVGGKDTVTPEIYTAIEGAGGCSSACNSYFNGPSSTDPFSDNNKTTTGVEYLVNGYPSTKLPPTPVYEVARTPMTSYYDNGFSVITSVYKGSLPSNCPHAVVHYFSTSSKPPLNYSDNIPGSSKNVIDYYPEGTKFVALVYDGTHTGGTGDKPKDTVDKLATIVGYVPIEVDGYANNIPALIAGNDAATYAQNKAMLNPTDGNTMYGHALSDIIQPDPSTPNGGCDFIDQLQTVQMEYAYPRLVGTKDYGDVKYGTANQ